MNAKGIQTMGAGLLLAGLLGLAAGCGEDAETDTALAITPTKADIAGSGTTVVMTVYDPDEGVYGYSPVYEDENQANKVSVDSGVNLSSNLDSQIFLPLEWSVSQPELGIIRSSAGYVAVYESFGGRGQNIVMVHDQVGRAGIAVVNHRSAEELYPEDESTTDETE